MSMSKLAAQGSFMILRAARDHWREIFSVLRFPLAGSMSASELKRTTFPCHGQLPVHWTYRLMEKSKRWLLLATSLLAAGALIWNYTTRLYPGYAQYLLSKLVAAMSFKIPDTGERQAFRNIAMTAVTSNPGHSHGDAAVDRSAANSAMDKFILSIGREPYSVSNSKRDTECGNAGNRAFYGAKDLDMEPSYDTIGPHHVLKFTDVDYYPDMNLYARFEVPMLMYTFAPRTVGGRITNGLTTVVDNRVEVKVDGGAAYQHELWDYDSDCIVVHFWNKTVSFLREAVLTNDPDRRIIGLFPNRVVYTTIARLLPSFELKRLQFQVGEINVLRFHHRTQGLMISVGFPGEYTSVTVPERLLQTILTRVGASDKAYVSDVERVVNNEKPKIEDAAALAAQIFRLLPHLKEIPQLNIQMDCGRLPDTVRDISYQTLKPLIFEDGKPSARIIGPQLCTGNVAPMRSLNNDTDCVQARVLDVKNTVAKWPKRFDRYAADFLRELVPDADLHRGVPMDTQPVIEQQNRPTQRRGFERVSNFMRMRKLIVSSFQKAESYWGFKHPRNISTVDADHRTRYASFIYPLSQEILKPMKSWAFGKKPVDIANRVHEVCRGATTVTPTDYSAWDGTHSADLVKLELALCLRYFHPRYHQEVRELLLSQYGATAFTKFGVKYNTGKSRLSGSSDTSDFNSLDNDFLQYCSYRDQGETHRGAMEALGVVGGDDGLAADVDINVFRNVAESLGHVIKAENLVPGDPVPFLGRYYLNAFCDNTSVCDIQRQAKKLHLSGAPLTVSSEECMLRKALGILATDSQTPVISHWANAVVRVLGAETQLVREGEHHDVSWFARQGHTRAEQFPQRPCETWDAAWEFAASQLETTQTHVREVCAQLDAAVSFDQFPTLAFTFTQPVSVEVAVNGTLISADEKEATSAPTNDGIDDVSTASNTGGVRRDAKASSDSRGPKSPRNDDRHKRAATKSVADTTDGPQQRVENLQRLPRSPSLSSVASTGTSSSAGRRGRRARAQAAVSTVQAGRGASRDQHRNGSRVFERSAMPLFPEWAGDRYVPGITGK